MEAPELEDELQEAIVPQDYQWPSSSFAALADPGPRGRGSPRIEEKWSRVISVHHDDPKDTQLYLINADLMMA